MPMAGFLIVYCSFAAQQKQSQSLRLDPYVSHRAGSIVVLPAANLRGPPDKEFSARARASVCTLLLYAPGLVSCVRQHASYQPSNKGNDGCSRWPGLLFFYFFRMLWCEEFCVMQSFYPHR